MRDRDPPNCDFPQKENMLFRKIVQGASVRVYRRPVASFIARFSQPIAVADGLHEQLLPQDRQRYACYT